MNTYITRYSLRIKDREEKNRFSTNIIETVRFVADEQEMKKDV